MTSLMSRWASHSALARARGSAQVRSMRSASGRWRRTTSRAGAAAPSIVAKRSLRSSAAPSMLIFHAHSRDPRGRAHGEASVRGLRQLAGPGEEDQVAGLLAHPQQSVHPSGQVMEVLAVSVPLPPRVIGLARPALGELLTDA